MIDGKNFFGLPVKNDLIIWNIATGQGNDYTTGCLLHYNYFKNYFNMIAVDLRKQKVLDGDSKTIRQISFTAKSRPTKTKDNVFYYWRSKRNRFRFFTKNCECVVVSFFLYVILV